MACRSTFSAKYGEVHAGVSLLSKQHSPSESHRRTRDAHASETAEDYVEAIDDILRVQQRCRVVDLAKRFAVSHVTVTRIVSRLQNEGLVDTEPYRPISLTAAGEKMAAKSRQRHEIVVAFLQAIGVSPHVAAIDAEGIEHHCSSETLSKMRSFVESKRPN